jgi:peptidyl-prolyl cis-trans isomerase A (cyclophilin A)
VRRLHVVLFLSLGLLTLRATAAEPDDASSQVDATAVTAAETVEQANPALLDPTLATEQAPDRFRVRFETTEGPFVVEVHRSWAPLGADRFYNLVRIGFYDGAAFFRNIEGFMIQFGIHGDPPVDAAWESSRMTDDPVRKSNRRAFVSFAMSGPHSRTTQVFINYSNGNSRLDAMGFSPFGKVVEGMDVVESLYSGYGEGAPRGKGPDQGRMRSKGNAYLQARFPDLDYVKSAVVE